jgi:hypothetical protein
MADRKGVLSKDVDCPWCCAKAGERCWDYDPYRPWSAFQRFDRVHLGRIKFDAPCKRHRRTMMVTPRINGEELPPERARRPAPQARPARPDYGYVLLPAHMDYTDLQRPGSVTIKQDERGRVLVEVANFSWGDNGSCREQVTKGMCWARDILNAAIENDRLVPGGHIVSVEASD